MARFRSSAAAADAALPRERQLTLFERLDALARRTAPADPSGPAVKLLCIVLALMALGLVLQASHAATISGPAHFAGEIQQQAKFRVLGLGVLLAAYWIGPAGLRRHLPALAVLAAILLLMVWIPPFAKPENGSFRWIRVPGLGLSFQPSELARILLMLWAADRCVRLGPRVREARRGLFPMLAVGLFFVALIGLETDIGGALIFVACFASVLWVGGVRPYQAAGALTVVGLGGLLLGAGHLGYVKRRIAVFLGEGKNEQVDQALGALGSGDWFGVGLGGGLYRNEAMPYQDSDYVFALVGEELGLVGQVLVLGLLIAFAWCALRLVLAVRDRYLALSAFGLLLSVCLQAMVHVQVVTGLAPPKGMTLPFLSDGGTSLVVSSLAVGLALGAARPRREAFSAVDARALPGQAGRRLASDSGIL